MTTKKVLEYQLLYIDLFDTLYVEQCFKIVYIIYETPCVVPACTDNGSPARRLGFDSRVLLLSLFTRSSRCRVSESRKALGSIYRGRKDLKVLSLT